MRRRLLFLPLLLPLVGAARDPLAGRIAGPPSDCISLQVNEGPAIAGDRVLLYRESGRRIWRTEPVGNCTPFREPATIVTDVFSGQLCRNDRFRVLRAGEIIAGPVCRYGPFVPYDLPAGHH